MLWQILFEPRHHVGVKLVAAKIVHRLVANAVVEDMRHVIYAVLLIAVDQSLNRRGHLADRIARAAHDEDRQILWNAASFSGAQSSDRPSKTPYIIRLQNGLPLSGSTRFSAR